jgi:hypothetical protein
MYAYVHPITSLYNNAENTATSDITLGKNQETTGENKCLTKVKDRRNL